MQNYVKTIIQTFLEIGYISFLLFDHHHVTTNVVPCAVHLGTALKKKPSFNMFYMFYPFVLSSCLSSCLSHQHFFIFHKLLTLSQIRNLLTKIHFFLKSPNIHQLFYVSSSFLFFTNSSRFIKNQIYLRKIHFF